MMPLLCVFVLCLHSDVLAHSQMTEYYKASKQAFMDWLNAHHHNLAEMPFSARGGPNGVRLLELVNGAEHWEDGRTPTDQ